MGDALELRNGLADLRRVGIPSPYPAVFTRRGISRMVPTEPLTPARVYQLSMISPTRLSSMSIANGLHITNIPLSRLELPIAAFSA